MTCSLGLARLGLQHGTALGSKESLVNLCAGLTVPKPSTPIVENGSAAYLDEVRDTPRLKVRQSTGRGFGLFTLDRIPAYSRLLSDDALLSLAQGEDLPQLWQKYCTLPSDLRDDFDALSFPADTAAKEVVMISKLEQRGYTTDQASAMARVNSKWQANAFKTAAPEPASPASHKWSYSLFGTVARINHSCTPNACAHYRPSGVEVVYALRDIQPNEEIEIAYFDMTMPYPHRQERSKAWGFQCCCPACSASADEAEHDPYEERVAHVHRHLSIVPTRVEPNQAIDSTQTAIAIAHSPDYPWLSVSLPKLYLSLFNLEAMGPGREAKLKEIFEKVIEWEQKITGPDSPTSIARRMKMHDMYPNR